MHMMELYTPLLIALISGVLSAPLPCIGPGDVNADSVVDAVDWRLMAHCLGGADDSTAPLDCGLEDFEYADVERDGDVDLRDAAEFQNVYSVTYFDYGPWLEDKEAALIAIHLSGALRAPVDLYDRVHQNLLNIRAAYPELEEAKFRGPYGARRLIVRPTTQSSSGELYWPKELRELTRYYQAATQCCCGRPCDDPAFWIVLFCDQLNMELVAQAWEELPEVEHASLDHYTCGACCGTYSGARISGEFLVHSFSICDHSCCCRSWVFEMDASNAISSVSLSCWGNCSEECP